MDRIFCFYVSFFFFLSHWPTHSRIQSPTHTPTNRYALTNYTSMDYARDYKELYDESPVYQGAAAFSIPFILLDAVTKAGTVSNVSRVMSVLSDPNYTLETTYGTIRFDSNMQLSRELEVTVYVNDTSTTFSPSSITSYDFFYPMPTWYVSHFFFFFCSSIIIYCCYYTGLKEHVCMIETIVVFLESVNLMEHVFVRNCTCILWERVY